MHRQNIYYVRRGDTLYKIALSHGTTVNRLLRLNPHIIRPDIIWPGEPIRLR